MPLFCSQTRCFGNKVVFAVRVSQIMLNQGCWSFGNSLPKMSFLNSCSYMPEILAVYFVVCFCPHFVYPKPTSSIVYLAGMTLGALFAPPPSRFTNSPLIFETRIQNFVINLLCPTCYLSSWHSFHVPWVVSNEYTRHHNFGLTTA